MSLTLLSGKVFLLITGASRGIGRQIAESFGSLLGNGSLVLLLARNSNGLKETASKLPKGIRVETTSVDLASATADQYRDIIRKALGISDVSQFERAVIVHNAASIGDLTKSTIAMTDMQIWRDYYDLNVFSPAILNGVFMEFFNDETKVARNVINITSTAEIGPSGSFGYYCSGKAARAMFFRVFAVENPDVNVLNYSPGPVETDMLRTAFTTVTHPETKKMFDEMDANDAVLTTEQTVNCLIEILKSQKYKSGDYVEYTEGQNK